MSSLTWEFMRLRRPGWAAIGPLKVAGEGHCGGDARSGRESGRSRRERPSRTIKPEKVQPRLLRRNSDSQNKHGRVRRPVDGGRRVPAQKRGQGGRLERSHRCVGHTEQPLGRVPVKGRLLVPVYPQEGAGVQEIHCVVRAGVPANLRSRAASSAGVRDPWLQ